MYYLKMLLLMLMLFLALYWISLFVFYVFFVNRKNNIFSSGTEIKFELKWRKQT